MTETELPLDATVLPEPKGFFDRRWIARRKKSIDAIAPVLRAALENGERVRYVAPGIRYQFAEFVFTGQAVAYYSNQTAMVLTDRRLLMINIGRGGKPRDIKNQVRLAEIRKVRKAPPFGSVLRFELADQTRLDFSGVQKRDRKAFMELVAEQPTTTSAGQSLEHLCPACLKVVPGKVGTSPVCPHPPCRIPFRDPRRAARLSALVPGVGDLYLRHHFFGALEFYGSIVALCIAVFLGIMAASAPDAESIGAALAVAVLLVGVPRVIDYFLTLHMGRKGLVPLSLQPVVEGAPLGPRGPKALPAFPAWAYGLFALGAISVAGAGIGGYALGQEERVLAAARDAAAAGDSAEALRLWDEADADGSVGANDRARMVLALYDGGDLTGGDTLKEGLAGQQIDAELADRIDAFVKRAQNAFGDYEEGYKSLLEGDEKAAWPEIDRALAFFQSLKRSKYPQSREAVLVEAAGELLSPPPAEEDVDAAAEFMKRAGDLSGDRVKIARARLQTLAGKADAGQALAGVDAAALPLSWKLLRLETLAATAEPGKIAGEAVTIQGEMAPYAAARRAALMARGGMIADAPSEVIDLAVKLAASQGWDQAAAALQAKLTER